MGYSFSLGETCIRQVPGRRRFQMDNDLLFVPIPFSQLTIAGRVCCMKWLWHSNLFPASYYIETDVCIVPVSVNTPGLYDFPFLHYALLLSYYVKSPTINCSYPLAAPKRISQCCRMTESVPTVQYGHFHFCDILRGKFLMGWLDSHPIILLVGIKKIV